MTLELNQIYNMDCLDGMRQIEDKSIDAIVTDPPYGLEFMGKEWDSFKIRKDGWQGLITAEARGGNDLYTKKGFKTLPEFRSLKASAMPAYQEWCRIWAIEALRVSKPGAHMLAFGGTRTHHRLMVAIEDAGWEIRDCLMWVYGSGFPKSLDVSKAIDKAAGVERDVVGQREDILQKQAADFQRGRRKILDSFESGAPERNSGFVTVSADITAPTTPAAKEWDGWGTALKPAWEPIILCRKPLEGTVSENVQKWGTGAINIDGCRVEYLSDADKSSATPQGKCTSKEISAIGAEPDAGRNLERIDFIRPEQKGRFPANLIHDGSDEVLEGFPQNAGAFAPVKSGMNGKSKGIYGDFAQKGDDGASFRGDSGSASRFFYCAKASKSERNLGLPEGTTNKHPTVKPLSLIEYLIKLISGEGGTVLDPFMGSGTTGIASVRLGRKFIGYELDKESFVTAETRLKKAQEQGKISEWF